MKLYQIFENVVSYNYFLLLGSHRLHYKNTSLETCVHNERVKKTDTRVNKAQSNFKLCMFRNRPNISLKLRTVLLLSPTTCENDKIPRTYQPVMYLSQLRSDSSKFVLSLSWSKETASECILLERASDSCYPILVIHFRTVPFVPMHSATMQVYPREETPNKSRDLHVPHLHLRTRSS